MTYEVVKIESQGLWSKPLLPPKWVARIKENWPLIIGEYDSEHDAIKGCANHAAAEVRHQIEMELGHWPD